MKKIYPALFHEDSGGYFVEFPDLPGCVSEGGSVEEAAFNASEALGLYLSVRSDAGEVISDPTDIRSFSVSDGFASLVSADPIAFKSKTRAIKKTLTIPEWLNEAAEKRNLNFSQVLQKALIELLA